MRKSSIEPRAEGTAGEGRRAAPPSLPSPMAVAGGSGSPPLRLPGSHFAAAFLFLLLGGAGLVAVAPLLARGAYLSPRVAAVTHLFTLGWITASIMGALYQLLPVALGRGVRWPALAQATLIVWVPGLLAFVAGLWTLDPRGVPVGAALVSLGVLLFCANLAATLAGAPRKDLTWWALAGACLFLLLTMVVGAALALNLHRPFMGSARLTALGTHIHVALVGWVLMVMVGVGQRLLPMFLLSHGAPEGWGKVSVASLFSGTFLLFWLHHVPHPLARVTPVALIVLGAAAFLLQAVAFFRTSKRPRLDPGMRLAASGLVLLGMGAALGVGLFLTSFTQHLLATAYVTTLVLGISLFVAGHQYKILPFLVWFHRFGPLAGRQPVPTVAELYSARWAGVAALLLGAGAFGLSLAVALGRPEAARAAAILFTAGALLEAIQLVGVALRRPGEAPPVPASARKAAA